ncbi:MAG: Ni-sirohydrochlorin a,c-diamide reductive cyclase catalytic subunit [Candidatus Methanomethylophilaceae archaeon]|nr:Ni-sirohydrochlorin a,c-diamide reductive cyclase catalytic subunit [Candidatus Methanomethylophilaceae archaeon]
MSGIFHPRPNPIVAAMYTARDMDVDVIVMHGPAGCSFMASRPLENAGVRVVTSSMKDSDLIFGGSASLEKALKDAKSRFDPRTVAVIGTCASTIIGDDVEAAIGRADMGGTVCFHIDCHGCLADNTEGAIRALKAGAKAGIIPEEEAVRQTALLKAATALEKIRGMAASAYISPAESPTKLAICRRIRDTLSSGGRVAVAMIAKKELAYRFADMFSAVDEARRALGGRTFFVANLDPEKGLPRIRGYCRNILSDLDSRGVAIDRIVGGLDEYAVTGDRIAEEVRGFEPDLTVVLGICHGYPDLDGDCVLVTDQPRELRNYLQQGLSAVGEAGSHGMVMGASRIVTLETAQTLRELISE